MMLMKETLRYNKGLKALMLYRLFYKHFWNIEGHDTTTSSMYLFFPFFFFFTISQFTNPYEMLFIKYLRNFD